jgi:DNA-binding MarR family transcriptional regulator
MPDHIDRIVEQWRRERPELDVAPLALLGRLMRTAALAEAALADGLGGHGLQPGWFDLLAALRRAGEPYELNPTQLMDAMMLSAGLVARRADPADRRGTLVGLTRRGKAVVDRAIETHVANEKRLLSPLSSAERRSLDDLLRKVLSELEAPSRL